MYSQKQTSVITSSSGAACLAARDRLLHDPLVAGRVAAQRRLSSSGMPNRMTPPSPSSAASLELGGQLVERELELARHRGDRLPHVAAGPHEQRQNQIGRAKAAFPAPACARPDGSADGAIAWSEKLAADGFGRLCHTHKYSGKPPEWFNRASSRRCRRFRRG